MGHAVARLRLEGPQLRSRRHQCPQRLFAALAPMAWRPEPLRRAVHKLRRERAPARRLPAAGLVCSRREPASRVLRRHMDPLDIRAEGKGGRGIEVSKAPLAGFRLWEANGRRKTQFAATERSRRAWLIVSSLRVLFVLRGAMPETGLRSARPTKSASRATSGPKRWYSIWRYSERDALKVSCGPC